MAVPDYSHIVVVVMENKDYSEIIGNPQAPYINSLASGGASLDNFSAITHPSEPNYFALYAGSTFGLASDDTVSEPDPTLATILQGAGKTFTGWVEHPDTDSGHNPWESFPEGTSVEQDFANFPTSNFASLPTVSFVIPNVDDDMHSGTVAQGDSWLQTNLSAYAQWAVNNNSLLAVVWDEGDTSPTNQIPAILYGADVVPGQYNTAYNDYNLLSTILGASNLTAPNNAAGAAPIAVFSTGALGPTGPGPSNPGGGNGETIGFSVPGPVVVNAQDNPLSITAAGTVTAAGSGVDGVDSSLGYATINNDGTISSAGGFGVSLSGSGTVNNGPRVGATALISGGSAAIRVSGAGCYIENWGTISGGNGVLLENGGTINVRPGGSISGTNFGVFAYTSNSGTIYNYGNISATNSAGILLGLGGKVENQSGATISGGSDGIYVKSGAAGTVTNTGSIRANGGAGVDLGDGGSVTNNAGGAITGSLFGMFSDGGAGTVANSGTIAGTSSDGIVLGAGGSVTNAAGATISGGSNGVYAKYRAAGTVTNSGSIAAANGAGVDLADGGGVTNAAPAGISGSAFGVFVVGGAGTVANNGKIAAATYDGILLANGGSVTNAAGATVSGGSNAIYVKYHGAGTVTNFGTITALGGAGVDLAGGGSVTNSASASISGSAIGVFVTGALGTVANSGVISGTSNDGVVLGAGGSVTNAASSKISGGSSGIYVKSGAAGTVTNSGSITGGTAGIDLAAGGSVTNNAAALVSGGSFGVFASSVAASVANSGTIASTNNIGVDLQTGGSVTNAAGGTISAPGFGVAVYGGSGTVTNSGTISGGVDSVRFSGSAVDRLVAGATAVFGGAVVGGSAVASNTLELAGGTGTIAGLSGGSGTATENAHSWAFSGFGTLDFDASGTWTLSGTDAAGLVVNNGSVVVAGSLGVATAIDSSSTGVFQLDGSAVLDVAAAVGTQTKIMFLGGSELAIDSAGSFGTGIGTASYAGPQLQDFAAGDVVDLKNVAASGATLTYNATSGVLQISGGAQIADLAFQTTTLGSGSFHTASDGGAGLLLTRS